MTDLQLYKHIVEYCSEIHKDGMCFVDPYRYEDFVKGLDLYDCEQGFDAHICAGGSIAFYIDDISHMIDDFDTFKEELLKEAI